jgi:hypothetical protein
MWQLPRDYPMVAPDYAAQRSALAPSSSVSAGDAPRRRRQRRPQPRSRHDAAGAGWRNSRQSARATSGDNTSAGIGWRTKSGADSAGCGRIWRSHPHLPAVSSAEPAAFVGCGSARPAQLLGRGPVEGDPARVLVRHADTAAIAPIGARIGTAVRGPVLTRQRPRLAARRPQRAGRFRVVGWWDALDRTRPPTGVGQPKKRERAEASRCSAREGARIRRHATLRVSLAASLCTCAASVLAES